jgi:hypothetical protein
MRRTLLVLVASLVAANVVACAEVTPMGPLGPNEEKEDLRELVEKVKGMAEATRAGEVKESNFAYAPWPAPDVEPVVQVSVVRCAPEMRMERPRDSGMVVVVAAGRTRGVIDER